MNLINLFSSICVYARENRQLLLIFALALPIQADAGDGCGPLTEKGSVPQAAAIDERIARLPETEDGYFINFRLTVDHREVQNSPKPGETHTPLDVSRGLFMDEMHIKGIIFDQDFYDRDNNIWIFVGRASRQEQYKRVAALAKKESIFYGKIKLEVTGSGFSKVSPLELKFMRFVQDHSISQEMLSKLVALSEGRLESLNLKLVVDIPEDLHLDEAIIPIHADLIEQQISFTEKLDTFYIKITNQKSHFDFIFNLMANKSGRLTWIEPMGQVMAFPARRPSP
jgi:hypothetical protein